MRTILLFITALFPSMALAQEAKESTVAKLAQQFDILDSQFMMMGYSFILGAITMVILLIILDLLKERNAKKKA